MVCFWVRFKVLIIAYKILYGSRLQYFKRLRIWNKFHLPKLAESSVTAEHLLLSKTGLHNLYKENWLIKNNGGQ